MQDFFEENSITYEVFELFEEFSLDRDKKSALRAVFRQMKEDYGEEPGEYIIALMSVYYCGLKNHFEDPKFKSELESLTKEHILTCFGEDEGKRVAEALDELLKMPPDPAVRKKINYSNPGSKNWKVGDLYAYRLRGEEIEKAGLSEKYAVIYCTEIEKKTSRTNDVSVYLFLCDEEDLKKEPYDILKKSFLVASFASGRYYLYLLVGTHHEYPTDEIRYLGNSMEFEHPPREFVFSSKLQIPRLVWSRFSDIVACDYIMTTQHLHNS